MMPVYTPYLLSRGLSAGETLTLQGIFSLTVMRWDVPAGILARWSMPAVGCATAAEAALPLLIALRFPRTPQIMDTRGLAASLQSSWAFL